MRNKQKAYVIFVMCHSVFSFSYLYANDNDELIEFDEPLEKKNRSLVTGDMKIIVGKTVSSYSNEKDSPIASSKGEVDGNIRFNVLPEKGNIHLGAVIGTSLADDRNKMKERSAWEINTGVNYKVPVAENTTAPLGVSYHNGQKTISTLNGSGETIKINKAMLHTGIVYDDERDIYLDATLGIGSDLRDVVKLSDVLTNATVDFNAFFGVYCGKHVILGFNPDVISHPDYSDLRLMGGVKINFEK